MTVGELRPKAEAGDTQAQLLLAMCYYRGEGGVAQSDSEAAKWLRKAANNGNSQAADLLKNLEEAMGFAKQREYYEEQARKLGNSI